MRRALAIGLVCGLLAGCAGRLHTTLETHDALVRLSITAATILFLNEYPQYRHRVWEIANTVLVNLGTNEVSVLAAVEKTVRDQIRWQALDIGVRAIVMDLISVIRLEIETVLCRHGIAAPAEVRVYTRRYLQAIAEAAWVGCTTCGARILSHASSSD